MEDSNENKRQECQYPQESMRMKCKLKYDKMQAKLEKRKRFYTMKSKNNATMLWMPIWDMQVQKSFKAPMWNPIA